MFILGLLLILAGLLVVVSVLFGEDSVDNAARILGVDLNSMTLFVLGVAAGAAIIIGLGAIKFGVGRSLRIRRERKQLTELSEKLDAVEADRRDEDEGRETRY